jgi:drug/metabolite transporter (DMT)-like permease
MWAILALGAALLTSFNPILYKRILRDVDTLPVVWAVTFLGLPLLGIFTVLLTPQMPGLDWAFLFAVIGSAVLNVTAHLASTKALKLEDASLVAPLLTFSPVFTVLIAAVFLGEIPSTRGLIGIGFLLVGAYWLTRPSGGEWFSPLKSLARKPGVVLVLLAGLLWAITPILEKTAIQHTNPSSPRFAAFIIDVLLVLLLTTPALRRGGTSFSNLRLHRRDLFVAGLIAGAAPVLGYTAFSLGPVGYVTTMFRFSSVITVFWAALFLKEHNLRRRLPASLLMVVGAVLLAS